MFSCDEHLAGRNPSQGSELCTVVEYMFSLEQSIAILGDPTLADKLERLAFNALPGTLTDDMWAHQYNQQPNQDKSAACIGSRGQPMGPSRIFMAWSPISAAARRIFIRGGPSSRRVLFMLSHDDGLAAVAYAPSETDTVVGGTRYHGLLRKPIIPSGGNMQLTINPSAALAFPASTAHSVVGGGHAHTGQWEGATGLHTRDVRTHRAHLEGGRSGGHRVSRCGLRLAVVQRLGRGGAWTARVFVRDRRELG